MRELDPTLARGLTAISPYLDEVVVAGGWVPYVYELVYDAAKSGRSPRTRDIDLAVPRSVEVREKSIDQLLVEAGFTCNYHSLDTPPVTKYTAEEGAEEIEIEFITDAPGSSEAVVSVQPDLTAQELRYVGLMLDGPWTVDLSEYVSGADGLVVRVPSPGAFILHKALVFRRRRDRLKMEKDLFYIFFVFDAFADWRESMTAELSRLSDRRPKWFARAVRQLSELFQGVDSEGIRYLANQRPETVLPHLDDDQFAQYALSTMSDLVELMAGIIEEG